TSPGRSGDNRCRWSLRRCRTARRNVGRVQAVRGRRSRSEASVKVYAAGGGKLARIGPGGFGQWSQESGGRARTRGGLLQVTVPRLARGVTLRVARGTGSSYVAFGS